MFQKALFDRIAHRLPAEASLIEEVAATLDISYDAAHRRTSLKSKLALEESVLLARRYHIALDGLFEVTDPDVVAVQKTEEVRDELSLQKYLERSYHSLLQASQQPETRLWYSAKDIPLFYLLQDDLLMRFKLFVWLKLLDTHFTPSRFDQYHPGLAIRESAAQLAGFNQHLSITEIWDVTTINSTLKQIHYYFEAGVLTTETAVALCDCVKQLLTEIAAKVASDTHDFTLYYHELLLLNNQVLIQGPTQSALYTPFSMLSYFLTRDAHTCTQASNYFEKQMEHAKLLNTSGEKDQNTFFLKMHDKVAALDQLIRAKKVLGYE